MSKSLGIQLMCDERIGMTASLSICLSASSNRSLLSPNRTVEFLDALDIDDANIYILLPHISLDPIVLKEYNNKGQISNLEVIFWS